MNYYLTYEGDEVSGVIETERTYSGPRFVPTTREEIEKLFPGYSFKPEPIPVVEEPEEEVNPLAERVDVLETAMTTLMDGLV